MRFVELNLEETDKIKVMSQMATEIVREHFDPIIGKEQNDYMLGMFQTEDAISNQLKKGYRYYFVQKDDSNVGFIAFYPKENAMYLSKFYLYKSKRGKGYSHQMMEFVIEKAKELNLSAIELNVNKENPACRVYERLGYRILRSEKNDIGCGFYMDDYVYRLEL